MAYDARLTTEVELQSSFIRATPESCWRDECLSRSRTLGRKPVGTKKDVYTELCSKLSQYAIEIVRAVSRQKSRGRTTRSQFSWCNLLFLTLLHQSLQLNVRLTRGWGQTCESALQLLYCSSDFGCVPLDGQPLCICRWSIVNSNCMLTLFDPIDAYECYD